MITFIVLVCVFAVFLSILSLRKRKKTIKNQTLFCECKIYGKFIDSEMSVDDIVFRLIK